MSGGQEGSLGFRRVDEHEVHIPAPPEFQRLPGSDGNDPDFEIRILHLELRHQTVQQAGIVERRG
jgi:hypothetical protein